MRVALCLYGHFRSFDRTYPNLKTQILDRYQPDIFMQAWTDTMGFWLPRHATPDPRNHPGFKLDSPPVPPGYLRSVINELKPVDMQLDHYYLHNHRFQQQSEALREFHNVEETAAPKSALSMNWIRGTTILMKRRHEMLHKFRYDRVIVTRWDINHTKPINLEELDSDVITFMKGGGDHPGDTWACGPSDWMDVWGEQYFSINELVEKKTMNCGPHEWQTAWFEHKNVPWVNNADLGTDILR